jgi:hypothetical protein
MLSRLMKFRKKPGEPFLQHLQCVFQPLVLIQKLFMLDPGLIAYLSVIFHFFQGCLLFLCFDGVFQVVDVDELDVKLVFVMLNIAEDIFLRDLWDDLPEFLFHLHEIFPGIAEVLPPGLALGGKL